MVASISRAHCQLVYVWPHLRRLASLNIHAEAGPRPASAPKLAPVYTKVGAFHLAASHCEKV
jgi:hypothetical protein